MATPNFNTWVARIAWVSITGLVAGGISWGAWITIMLFSVSSVAQSKPTIDDVREIVITQTPYIQDKRLIDETLAQTREVNKELKIAIENNTRAIIKLEASLGKE